MQTFAYILPSSTEGGGMARQRKSAALPIAVAGAIFGAAAQAQSAGGTPELEEVVVSAQKTGTQTLQSVPLAIQAFDGEELKEKNITSIGDLASAVPGAFEGQRQSAASRSYNLRGQAAATPMAIHPSAITWMMCPSSSRTSASRRPSDSSISIAWKCCAARRAPCMARVLPVACSYSAPATRASRSSSSSARPSTARRVARTRRTMDLPAPFPFR